MSSLSFSQGYQAALRDLATKLDEGDLVELLKWGVNNASDPSVKASFDEALSEVRGV